MTTVESSFESLPMRKRELIHISSNQYRILSNHGEEKNVEANTAYEAFKLAGLKDAIKIERLSVLRPIVIKKTAFAEKADNTNLSDAQPLTEAEEFAQIRKLMKPVMSADDLDKIIHSGIIHEPVVAVAKNVSVTEVHGDGFDEIIPTAPLVSKPQVAAKEPPPARVEIPQTKDQTITPEQNLSAEEVEKLLGNK